MTKPMKIAESELAKKLYSNKKTIDLLKTEKREDLNTGISIIDKRFGFPTGYYVILGNPGTGKSWFALWLSRMFYRHNQMCSVYFSLEMAESAVRKRILQQWSDLTKDEIELNQKPDKALELLQQDTIVVDEFYSEDAKHQTVENFEAWIDAYYEIGFRIFQFDHLHELFGANDNSTNQTVTEKWAKCFQRICKKYDDIWLFVFAQPNGAAADKKILRRTDIAGSKAITQKCDYFLSLNRLIVIDDKTGLPTVESSDRQITLYLDKTRYTEESHIGFQLFFAPTGNFFSITNEEINE